MPERLPRLTPPFDSDAVAAVYEAITGGPRSAGPQRFPIVGEDGSLAGPFGLMLHAPAVGGPLQALGSAVRFETSFDDRTREVAVLSVAAAVGSAFEWVSHEALGRAAGLSAAELAALRDGSFGAVAADPVEAQVASVAALLAAGGDLDDPAYARAVAALGEEALVELVVLVGYYRSLALLLRTFRVDPAPEDAAHRR